MQILAADIGGTNTRLALFEEHGRVLKRKKTFDSRAYKNLLTIVNEFLEGEQPDIASLGIAGPVEGSVCRATNLPWVVDSKELERSIPIGKVHLINDLLANAYGVEVLEKEDFAFLQKGIPEQGNRALISPGTGLGEAGIVLVNGAAHPFASEGGHADFAPTDPLQEELLAFLRKKFSCHISYERVLSGPGLAHIYTFLVEEKGEKGEMSPAIAQKNPHEITKRATQKKCPCCVLALKIFLAIYGAEAGNLALKFLALSGIYLGGGIVPHIVPQLREGTFLEHFTNKGRFRRLLEKVPIKVVLNDQAALLGAFAYAVKSSA
ncbi:MAG: glucokinase [Chlamydiota bacterium]